MEVLKNIITRVNSSPKVGVAIKDNNADRWVYRMHTLDKMKQKGFNDVESFLNHVYDLGYSDITVYLKRLNGTSSVYLDNISHRLTSKKPVSQTALEFQEPKYLPVPTETPKPMENNSQNHGLLGGLNQQQYLNTYSKAQQFDPLAQKYNALEVENKSLRDQLDKLKFENLKLEMNAQPKKPVVSDELGGMLLNVLPTLAEKFGSAKTGLAGAKQIEDPIYSQPKTQLLNLVKNNGFTDDYCILIHNVCNTLFEDTTKAKELIEFTTPTTEATT